MSEKPMMQPDTKSGRVVLREALREIDDAMYAVDAARRRLPESMSSEKQQLESIYQKLDDISFKVIEAGG